MARSRDRERRRRSRSRDPHRRRRSRSRTRSRSPRRRWRKDVESPEPSSSGKSVDRAAWDREREKKAREKEKKLRSSMNSRMVSEKELEGKTPEEIEMMTLMGFSGFDSTKNKKVKGNDVGDVHHVVKRKYRQYMNRKGGFNRPLDAIH